MSAHEYNGLAFGRAGRKDGKLTRGQPLPCSTKRLDEILNGEAAAKPAAAYRGFRNPPRIVAASRAA